MALIAIRCPECHGDVQMDDSREFGFCVYCGTRIMIRGNDAQTSSLAGQVANLKPLMMSYFESNDLLNARMYARKIIEINGADADVWYVEAVAEISRSNSMLEWLKRDGTVPGLVPLRNYEILSGRRADPVDVDRRCYLATLFEIGSTEAAERWMASEWRKRMGKEENLVLPTIITKIAPHMFEGFHELRCISIPSSVTAIGEGAFQGCKSLASVSIPASVTSIGEAAFEDCASLESVVIPTSVTSIERGTFAGCGSLASVSIPASVTSIGREAFQGCKSLASVSIPAEELPGYVYVGGERVPGTEVVGACVAPPGRGDGSDGGP